MEPGTECADVEKVIEKVAELWGITPEGIKSARPRSKHKEARQIAAYAATEATECSLNLIAEALGRKDHTEILWGREQVKSRMSADPVYRFGVMKLIEGVAGGMPC